MSSGKQLTKDLCYIAVCAALIAVCSWISIPATVSFTMQTFAVALIAALFGTKISCLSIIVYILTGALGVPVFSGFRGGIGVLAGATGGYIVGFLLMALAESLIIRASDGKTVATALAMVVGLVLCYAFGTAWFICVYTSSKGAIGLITVLSMTVFPFVIPDLLKLTLALFLSKRVKKLLPHR